MPICGEKEVLGALLIFINPVIKTKEAAVPFKSVLSGVHQVPVSLPESGEDPVTLPRAAKCKVPLL